MKNTGQNVEELPSYKAFFIVDIKNFSGEKGRDHDRLTEAVPKILAQAFQRCGLAGIREKALFHGTTGDGYYLGFESKLLPFLLNPLLPALQDELAYQNSITSNTIRMRVSINIGPMTDPGPNPISAGSGNARIETHRLLDSEPVRDLLTRSNDVTCVAAIVSKRAFEDAVLAGYSDEAADLYVQVEAQEKTYTGTAYLRVPSPSGDLLTNGFLPAAEPKSTSGDSTKHPDQRATGLHTHHGDRHYTGDGLTHVEGTLNGGIQHQFGRRDQ